MRAATWRVLGLIAGLGAMASAPAGSAGDAVSPRAALKNRVVWRSSKRRVDGRAVCQVTRISRLRSRITLPADEIALASFDDATEFEYGYVVPGQETPLFGPIALGDAIDGRIDYDGRRGRVRVRGGGQRLRLRWNAKRVRLTHRCGDVFLADERDVGQIATDARLYVRLGNRRFMFEVPATGTSEQRSRRCAGEYVSLYRAALKGEVADAASSYELLRAHPADLVRSRVDEILADASSAHLPRACAASPTPLFQNTDPFDVLPVTVRADFDVVNGESEKDDARSPGSVSYADPTTGGEITIDCTVEARGGSRFRWCRWRPLRLRFDDDPVGTLFEGTGSQIKIVTHCDWDENDLPPDRGIVPGTQSEDTRRILQEFALYEVLGALGTTALETRLILLTFENPLGVTIKQEVAFFREREKRAAERCGFERLEIEDGDPRLPPDPASAFQAEFHHRFVFSHDFDVDREHNVIRMGSPEGTEHYIPYDFDLSGVVQPGYRLNEGWSIQENGRRLVGWLRLQRDQALARAQVAALLRREDEMRSRLDGGPIDDAGRERLLAWFDDHVRRLKCYLME